MKHLRLLLNFYIHSSMHVALAVLAMTYVTLLELHLGPDWNLLYFVFFSTITGYNFVKYFGLARFHHRSLANWLKIIQVFSLFCFLLMLWFAFKLTFETLLWIGVFALVTFLYAVPFLPRHLFMDHERNLRNIGGIKVYVIGVVWAGVTVLLPVLNDGAAFSMDVWLTAFQRFLLVMLLMLPFEIRDLQYDSLRLATIPQKIGIKNTKIIGVVLAVVFLMLEFLKEELTTKLIILTLAITLITVLFILFSNKKRTDYYSSFWVESVPILWLLLHFVF
ncbi:hypothetical protein ES711_11160 [Gelidibacter salicanalis]|uniref:Prenyltransferase n=1 Tax=Gelidibacter salicanalis TaxID=291193 RepID=A0A5C7AIK7_9FLAO|nr:hypothetical protein [Gelidibacter salicanalis]TXE07323.1 hypothetical protein ES711_11160 [Gelidibacter salicanalis]